MAFSSAFLSGMRAREARDERIKREKMEKEMAGVMSAQPEQSTGYTAEQGAELERAAQSGQYDIGMKTNDDGTFAGYTVTPKSDPAQTAVVAQQGVTDFLGKRTAGALSADDVTSGRQMALAGVLAKNGDPMAALRLEREAKQGSREDARFEREQKRWEKEDRKDAEDEGYKAERTSAMSNLRFAQNETKYNAAMKEYVEAQKQYEQAKAEGKPVGVAPTAPQRAEYSIGDSLADRATLLEVEIKHGRANPDQVLAFGEALRNAQDEGYVSALKKLQSGADLTEVAKEFNSTGKVQFDPAAVVSDKTIPGKNGAPPSRVIQFKDANGKVRTISALAELDALDKADKIYTRHFQQRQDDRSERADARDGARLGLAQAKDAREQQEQKEDRETRAALYKERNPEATPAQLAAVRRGILSPTGETEGITSDYKPDSFSAGGKAVQKDKRGNIVVTEIKPDGTQGKTVTIRAPGATAAPTEKPDKATAYEQAKAAVAKGADKAKVNERLKKMGYAPLNDW